MPIGCLIVLLHFCKGSQKHKILSEGVSKMKSGPNAKPRPAKYLASMRGLCFTSQIYFVLNIQHQLSPLYNIHDQVLILTNPI